MGIPFNVCLLIIAFVDTQYVYVHLHSCSFLSLRISSTLKNVCMQLEKHLNYLAHDKTQTYPIPYEKTIT